MKIKPFLDKLKTITPKQRADYFISLAQLYQNDKDGKNAIKYYKKYFQELKVKTRWFLNLKESKI